MTATCDAQRELLVGRAATETRPFRDTLDSMGGGVLSPDLGHCVPSVNPAEGTAHAGGDDRALFTSVQRRFAALTTMLTLCSRRAVGLADAFRRSPAKRSSTPGPTTHSSRARAQEGDRICVGNLRSSE